jgi:hypothetical protein
MNEREVVRLITSFFLDTSIEPRKLDPMFSPLSLRWANRQSAVLYDCLPCILSHTRNTVRGESFDAWSMDSYNLFQGSRKICNSETSHLCR